MKKILCMLLLALPLACWAQSKAAKKVASYHEQGITCLAAELDGSVTLRVTGSGASRADAKEQARKNAVWAVVFDGVPSNVKGVDCRPLLNEANAREKYEEYFDIFFADGGEYLKYVSGEDAKILSCEKKKNKVSKNFTLTVRVLRSELKARLKADNVLKTK